MLCVFVVSAGICSRDEQGYLICESTYYQSKSFKDNNSLAYLLCFQTTDESAVDNLVPAGERNPPTV